MHPRTPLRVALTALLVLVLPVATAQSAPKVFVQQGPKLVGSGSGSASPSQGTSVAISSDGNTVIVGGPNDVNPATGALVGAAWVFTRTNGVWTPQGSKLVGTGATGDAKQGTSVALSADGNTAIIGAPADNGSTGAAWVFTRSNGAWMQQGPKLIGSGAVGLAQQGTAVSLSADGNTAIVGGPTDTNNTGASWIFTRSNGVWSQLGSKLVGQGFTKQMQANAVALSGDGNTALVGAVLNSVTYVFAQSGGVWTQQGAIPVFISVNLNSVALSFNGNTALQGLPEVLNGAGEAGVWTRSGTTWTSQGGLQGTGAVGDAHQGFSVSLSADGHTAIIGGNADDAGTGAAWAFANNGTAWNQMGSKLVGSGTSGASAQGTSVALSADGMTAVVGGPGDSSGLGAAWIFIAASVSANATHDFNGDGRSDLLWRNANSFQVSNWLMNGAQVVQSFGLGPAPSEQTIVGQRDFNGDGSADLLWRNTNGDTTIWFLNAGQKGAVGDLGFVTGTWSVVGTGDFNGDGLGDILWQDASGNLAVWLMNGTAVLSSAGLGNVPAVLAVAGIGDFNGDGKSDILWRDTSGNTSIWFMNGTQVSSTASIGNIATNWSIVGTGDFNGDGMSDIVWRDTAGDTAIWLMNGAQVSSSAGIGNVPPVWSMAQTGDYDGDGKGDLLWRDTSGNMAIWFMNGTVVSSSASVGNVPSVWTLQTANSE
jgi:hypothetical protein